MAKVQAPLLSMVASGQIGRAMTFDKRGFVRNYAIPANPQTTAQVTVRNRLADIQAELKQLGPVLRGQLKTGFGYRWNSMIIKELMKNDGQPFTDDIAVWNAFGSTDKTAWTTDDPAITLFNSRGGVFYAVATATKDLAIQLGVTLTLATPIATNSATVKSNWIA